MHPFSDVDASGRAAELVEYLDRTDRGLHAPKETLRAGLDLPPGGRVLDLGCGAGHELVQLERAGFQAYGVDPSAAMVSASRERLAGHGFTARLALADGQRLPYADGFFDGCRIERVLQHVPDPSAALGQALRVLRPGGRIAVLEPDWASVTLASADAEAARAVAREAGGGIAHRAVGRHLRRLLAEAGFQDVRIEVELVVYSSIGDLSGVISLERAAARACDAGRIDEARAAAWLAEQRELSERGMFHATFHRSVLAWARRPAGVPAAA
ncbi:SAM-dependent methyltransferase [Catenulispora sp. GP43]|uniref:methyltransferase domain-containing protein n=1 Tax=Catenulispora sp. GP43 TaxID=3156263 RepID=UPI0035129C7C